MNSKLVKHRTGLPSLERRLPEKLVAPPPPDRSRPDAQFDLPGLYGFVGRMFARRRSLILTVMAIVIAVVSKIVPVTHEGGAAAE